jgi:hypothetical protein
MLVGAGVCTARRPRRDGGAVALFNQSPTTTVQPGYVVIAIPTRRAAAYYYSGTFAAICAASCAASCDDGL